MRSAKVMSRESEVEVVERKSRLQGGKCALTDGVVECVERFL